MVGIQTRKLNLGDVKMMTNKRKRDVKIVVLLVCVIIIAGVVTCKRIPYKCNYMEKIGISLGTTYDEVIEEFGKPDKIEEDQGMWSCILDYGDKRFYFTRLKNGTPGPIDRVDILNNSIQFGWCKVQVGMPRNKIEKIYSNNEKITDIGGDTLGVIDGSWWIYFKFNENEILKEIDFCFGP